MKRRRIHVLCLQETRWKGSKAREIEEGIKLFYHGFGTRRNGVAIAIAGPLKEHVSSVNRTVVSVYAPQCGCIEADKEAFYDELDDVIRSAPEGDYITIAGDFNGHVGQDRRGFERVHGGTGFGKRNQEEERIIELAEAHDLAIASTFFIKRESQKITYCSGGRQKHVSSVNRVSDRIISLRIATEAGFWTVVPVYAPQCGCIEADKEAFYDELDDVIRSAPEALYFVDHLGDSMYCVQLPVFAQFLKG
ncbi:hypothetical protein ANCCEY_05561 [Ancylostoma ceylanicum]|uniref:Endonuclease/exonuclease/phosphatase domain-containing protein n=1 Tax=Ancylostoma ceylanicum TaxID=53326 RepID=A0A0D6M642_9BILA|nr:hypothetical protein ANCCEY_05561 [Ancylostoma ceylanicum]